MRVGGYSLLRVTWLPIAFLLFAIPLPYFVDSVLTLQLQLVSSQLGSSIIELFQIPVYVDGNIIDLGNAKLEVAEACSGLRYLYPLLSLSFLAAYLFRAPRWQQAIVALSAIPIAIVMNGVRLGIVGILVSKWGSAQAEGFTHLFEGWVIFIACAALLAGEIFLLARFSGKTFSEVFYAPSIKPQPQLETGEGGYSKSLVCLATVIIGGLAIAYVSSRDELVPERARFATFPNRLGQWQGRTSNLDIDVEQALKLSDYILSDYSDSSRKAVNLYVAYYASQRLGESPHSPIVCIPAGGWQISRFERTEDPNFAEPLPFNRVVITKDKHAMLVLLLV